LSIGSPIGRNGTTEPSDIAASAANFANLGNWGELAPDMQDDAMTEWCRGQFYPDTMNYWMPMLQNSMIAFDDLECSKLWPKTAT
jgi:hypothetical protein